MDCIIIDDETTARVILRSLCDRIDGLNVVDEFSNATQAIKFLNENEVDLIFLDLHMPNFSGLDFAKSLKDPPNIIFTTLDPKFAIDAFEYDFVVDYLLKPIEFPRFEKAILKVKKRGAIQQADQKKVVEGKEENVKDFYINIDRRLIKIDIDSVNLVQAKGDYIKIKTEGKDYIVHSTLKKIYEKLPKSLFLKVHRSYIINLKKIIDIEDNSVLIKKDVVPVSRSNRPELMKRLDLL